MGRGICGIRLSLSPADGSQGKRIAPADVTSVTARGSPRSIMAEALIHTLCSAASCGGAAPHVAGPARSAFGCDLQLFAIIDGADGDGSISPTINSLGLGRIRW